MAQGLEKLKDWIGEPSADGKSAKLWTMDATGALATNASAEFA